MKRSAASNLPIPSARLRPTSARSCTGCCPRRSPWASILVGRSHPDARCSRVPPRECGSEARPRAGAHTGSAGRCACRGQNTSGVRPLSISVLPRPVGDVFRRDAISPSTESPLVVQLDRLLLLRHPGSPWDSPFPWRSPPDRPAPKPVGTAGRSDRAHAQAGRPVGRPVKWFHKRL